ncbi:diguanylate cyclase [Sphaerotilus hippei]|uniref:diguanylate cyclase n=1 Tax=Sphaerotilus hippei TaxID=744406 RepID=A0A318GY81_9BURK|nr:GGDEF domain-containing protein [Sphaerotilus hippei]PXW93560.1 diguanylate cyclase [Sphaerotilus hippei]
MRYEHSIERSTELLRAALPLMSRQQSALHPISYAVWYEYVCGGNPSLREAVDAQLAQHQALDEVRTRELFTRHIAEIDPGTAQRVSDGFSRVLTGMAESAALAGDQTARFGDSLSRLSADLLVEHDPGSTLLALQDSTRDMQSAMARLQQRLAESQREILQLRDEVRQARQDSLIDSLTGLANRRAFDERMQQWAGGDGPPHAGADPHAFLMLADIDHFKRVNDTYGHAFGDQVIKAVAQVLQQFMPGGGLAARIGGEEFALLMPAADAQQARDLAEQVRRRIAGSRIRRQGRADEAIERITVSLGLTRCRPGDSAAAVIDRADQALYQSKQGGRDRVTLLAA